MPSRHEAVTVTGARCNEAMQGGEGRDEMGRSSDDVATESTIKVCVERGRVVVRPVGHLGRDSLETLVDLVGCARQAGVIAVVELDAIEPGDLAGNDLLARLAADGLLTTSFRS
jgi:hypothetical protein